MKKKKKRLKLENLEIESFITNIGSGNETINVKGGWTGDCGSFINRTCPDPDCDFQSIPLNECGQTITICGESIVCASAPINPCQ
jgi:hypothetical protein